jgi:hypothetical protein
MRPFHWLYAHLFGYFWTRCPRCMRCYGGHQWSGEAGDAMTVQLAPDKLCCTYCPDCAKTRDEWDLGWRQREWDLGWWPSRTEERC